LPIIKFIQLRLRRFWWAKYYPVSINGIKIFMPFDKIIGDENPLDIGQNYLNYLNDHHYNINKLNFDAGGIILDLGAH
jgi:hypothetical protein